MNELMMKLWDDDAGYILSAESVFLFTIAVLGVTVGMAAIRNATVAQMTQVANSISALDTSYTFTGLSGCGSSVNGTNFGVSLGNTVPAQSLTPVPAVFQLGSVSACQ